MKTSLFKNLPEDEKSSVVNSFNNGRIFREALAELLRTRMEPSVDVAQYEKAGWNYYAADQIGYRRALKEVLALIETKE